MPAGRAARGRAGTLLAIDPYRRHRHLLDVAPRFEESSACGVNYPAGRSTAAARPKKTKKPTTSVTVVTKTAEETAGSAPAR